MTPRLRLAYRGGDDAGRPGWHIAFDYDADVIQGLKEWIPAGDRRWDPVARQWWVAGTHEEKLLAFFPGFQAFRDQAALF